VHDKPSISEYFGVLAPHPAAERDARQGDWAVERRDEINEELARRGPAVWYSKIEVIKESGLFTSPNAIDTTAAMFFSYFGWVPADLEGMRVLDIGAFSGAMTFYAEDCGAEVVALDIQDPQTNGFGVIHSIRRSTATHVVASVYDLHPDLFGAFDVVVFSGVHYHLKHPLLALERLNSVTRPGGAMLTLGSAGDYWLHKPEATTIGLDFSTISSPDNTVGANEIPLLGFYRDTYMKDESNWFIPNTKALADMISVSGYEIISAHTFPTDLPDNAGRIACAIISARKAGEPKGEYPTDVYSRVRKLHGSGTVTTPFSVPTWYELELARRTAVRHQSMPAEIAASGTGSTADR
jgi:tRNA (mo5U34)-methyltransferase